MPGANEDCGKPTRVSLHRRSAVERNAEPCIKGPRVDDADARIGAMGWPAVGTIAWVSARARRRASTATGGTRALRSRSRVPTVRRWSVEARQKQENPREHSPHRQYEVGMKAAHGEGRTPPRLAVARMTPLQLRPALASLHSSR
jgi:hypothetical protein